MTWVVFLGAEGEGVEERIFDERIREMNVGYVYAAK